MKEDFDKEYQYLTCHPKKLIQYIKLSISSIFLLIKKKGFIENIIEFE